MPATSTDFLPKLSIYTEEEEKYINMAKILGLNFNIGEEGIHTYKQFSRQKLDVSQINSVLILSTWRQYQIHMLGAQSCKTATHCLPDANHQSRLLPTLLWIGGSNNPSLGFTNLLEWPRKLKETFINRLLVYYKKIYLRNNQPDRRDTWGKVWGKGKELSSWNVSLSPNLHMFNNPESFQAPSFWVWGGGFIA